MQKRSIKIELFENYGEDMLRPIPVTNIYRLYRITIRLKHRSYFHSVCFRLPRLPKMYIGFRCHIRKDNV